MKIRLERGPAGSYVVRADSGASILVQVDWDFAGLAGAFGWVPCVCGETDGTVDCPHRMVGEMLSEAREYLDRCLGETVEDPGYFSSESSL